MKKNVGSADRLIRIVVGAALIAWALFGGGSYSWIGWIGVVPLLTAGIGWCPAYMPFGIRTCRTGDARN